MLERLRAHLAESALIPHGSRVLVGYSGGADSTALLHLLNRCEIEIVAAHLHHGQRDEANEELERCQAFAESIGVSFVAGHSDVPKLATDHRIGIEEAGRNARYGFFAEAAGRTNCGLIATAHTRTDNVETILLNMIRGAGLGGMIGIPERRDNIVRPLLPFSRHETRKYCEEHGLWTHDDPANVDLSFSRARIRHRVVPEIELINPSFDTSVHRLADIAKEEDRFLNGMAAAALEKTESRPNGDLYFLTADVEVRLDRAMAAHLPPVLLKRGLRLACTSLDGALSFDQTNLAASGIYGPDNGSITADGGDVVVEWDAKYVECRNLSQPDPFRFSLMMPGETFSDEFGWQLSSSEVPFDGRQPKRSDLSAMIDRQKTKGELYFRSIKPGDTMQPLGFIARRKLADILSESKLTKAARLRLPIVCDMVGPLWAPGVCVDERARPSADSVTVVQLRFGPLRS